jgi:hypothetical protein
LPRPFKGWLDDGSRIAAVQEPIQAFRAAIH